MAEQVTETFIPPRIRHFLNKMIDKERIAHAYLFSGQKGSGKKEAAQFFAQRLFCTQPSSAVPCAVCTACERIKHGNHPDVHWLSADGASIKIDQIRHLQKEFGYRGMESRKKVYIVEAVETMTTQAANSLLKFLEDPHPQTVALLLTENRHQLLPTIISRCQEIRFPPPVPEQVARQLSSTYGAGLATLAAHVTPDLEEATTLCHSDWFAALKALVIQLTQEISKSKGQSLYLIQDEWMKLCKEKEQTDVGLDMLLFWYKDLLYTKRDLSEKRIYIEETKQLAEQSQRVSEQNVTLGMTYILEAKGKLQAHVHPQLLLEQLTLRLQSIF